MSTLASISAFLNHSNRTLCEARSEDYHEFSFMMPTMDIILFPFINFSFWHRFMPKFILDTNPPERENKVR